MSWGTWLKKSDETIVEARGHTDRVGKPDYNLAERRATAIAQYPIAKGIQKERTMPRAPWRNVWWPATTANRDAH